MSLVYTQTATPPNPLSPLLSCACPRVLDVAFSVTELDFLATWEGLLALPGFLLRPEFGKHAGDIGSFSNSIHLPTHSFLQQRFAK